VIAVSAGHYPAARGATFGAEIEYEHAVLWAGSLTAALRALGQPVFQVPTGTLTSKIAAINAAAPTCAIEIHFNADGAHKGRGCETLYAPNSLKGIRLATDVQDAVARVCPPGRGCKPGWYRADVPGRVDYAGDVDGDEKVVAILLKTNCPTVIVEPLFIHEVDRLTSLRAPACEAMALALSGFVKTS